MNFNQFHKFINEYKHKTERNYNTEYHYLVVNKNDGQILLKSIFDIHEFKTNPSNILQINWSNELKHIDFVTLNSEFNTKIQQLLKTIQTSVIKDIENKKTFADSIVEDTKIVKDTVHNLGQYFTTHIDLKEKLFSFILNNPKTILEPSIGRGDLVTFITEKCSNVKFDMYEIDTNIKLLDKIKKEDIIYGDFMKQTISKMYNTIIGNPPYVKTKTGNLYIEFTEKCYNLLDDNGELIFIVPSDFLKLTSASKLLNIMITNGTFTHIFHPHNEKMFEGASIDVIIFRYCKNILLEKKVIYNNKSLYITNSDGLITFNEEQNTNSVMFKEYFDIYVGLVSGKEEIYKNETLGNIEVLNGENKKEKYIYIDEYPCSNKEINQLLLENKKTLIERGIRKFNEKNWFEWGAPRNIQSINKNIGKDCIYIYNLTRKTNIAFIGKVGYFGGSLIMLIPKTNCNLTNVIAYLNSDSFKNNFVFSGRFKIGHRQISNSYLNGEF
jgi:adenine-specific DNA-methyltransferase